VPAGLVELPRGVFYLWTALGTLIWTAALALGGFVLEDQFHKVADWAEPIGFVITILFRNRLDSRGGHGWI
jgi:membrane protein DedA with SNARE-associated domain